MSWYEKRGLWGASAWTRSHELSNDLWVHACQPVKDYRTSIYLIASGMMGKFPDSCSTSQYLSDSHVKIKEIQRVVVLTRALPSGGSRCHAAVQPLSTFRRGRTRKGGILFPKLRDGFIFS